jgi:hypothetical protein
MKRNRNQRRRQGGGGGGGGGGMNPNRALDSNGPDVRIRGTANQIYEKYQALARDAASSGDRVKAENYLQHAEHYFRLIRSLQPAQPPPGAEQQPGEGDFESEQPTIGDYPERRPDSGEGERRGPEAEAEQPHGEGAGDAGRLDHRSNDAEGEERSFTERPENRERRDFREGREQRSGPREERDARDRDDDRRGHRRRNRPRRADRDEPRSEERTEAPEAQPADTDEVPA